MYIITYVLKTDIYIINTCTVTNTSDVKSRKMIRNAIKRNPDACVVAMGCFIEANKDYSHDGVSIIIGNKDKNKVVELVEKYLTNRLDVQGLYKNIELVTHGLTASKLQTLSSEGSFDTDSILTTMNADFYQFVISDDPNAAKAVKKDKKDSKNSKGSPLPAGLEPID